MCEQASPHSDITEAAAGSLRVFTGSYPGRREQIRQVRADAARFLDGCPVAEDVILCLSEVGGNAVLHSRSGLPGGHFTVRIEHSPGGQVIGTVTDDGGPWIEHAAEDDDILRDHGLGIVRKLSADMGIGGNAARRSVWFACDRRRR